MPKYRVLAKSYIGNTIREVGEVVEYDGKPGRALELIEDTKPEVKAKGKGKAAAAPEASEGAGDAGADLV